jgi:hypothetical protein
MWSQAPTARHNGQVMEYLKAVLGCLRTGPLVLLWCRHGWCCPGQGCGCRLAGARPTPLSPGSCRNRGSPRRPQDLSCGRWPMESTILVWVGEQLEYC